MTLPAGRAYPIRTATVTGCRNTCVALSRKVLFRSQDWGTEAKSIVRMPVEILKRKYSDSLVRERTSRTRIIYCSGLNRRFGWVVRGPADSATDPTATVGWAGC